ncbi:MAP9 protein, partial [Atrichornis clamosus]|nr:MAP9 protein [Atrichornis clamosus]
DQKTVSTKGLKLEDNGRKSPSVIEEVMTTVCGKTAADSSDGMVKIAEGQIIADTMQEVSVNDQTEHLREAQNTSKSSVKVLLIRSLPLFGTLSWKHKGKFCKVPKKGNFSTSSTAPVSSQYLGSLKVLEDKCMRKESTEFDEVDSLRAAVFQNWLEKKKFLLLELKTAEKEKAEILRNNTAKKEALKREESIACFEAWKKKKAREAKKLSEKKKLEELEEKKPAEQNTEKTEAAQMQHLVCYMMTSCSSLSLCRNEKKEEYIKKKKVEKLLERRKQEMQRAKKEEKNEKALEEYERWLENKERREQLEKNQKKLQAVHGNEMSRPWRPPGKVTYSSNY